jgi:membrane-bound serine protease (ClpP class)
MPQHPVGRIAPVLLALAAALGAPPSRSSAQDAAKPEPPAPAKANANAEGKGGTTPGQFFPAIVEPIDGDEIGNLRAAVQTYLDGAAGRGERPVLVFEFRPGDSAPGRSSFGSAVDLADLIAREFAGAKQTVAYVPQSLSGFAVLPVLACDEIVLGPDASLGPIAPADRPVTDRERAAVTDLARLKGRDPDLLLGLLEPSRDLREVRTAAGTRFVLKENLEAFAKEHAVLDERSAWEGSRGVLTPEHARRTIVKLTAESPSAVAEWYGLPSTAIDPTLAAPADAMLIPIKGRVDALAESYLLRQIAQAREARVNLILFEINSEGGLFDAADQVASAILALEGIRTVAYVDDRALGVTALVALACDEIVLRQGARLGDVDAQIVDAGGRAEPIDERLAGILADRAETLARAKGRPPAVARALVDPNAVVHRARDRQTGRVALVDQATVAADPQRYEVVATPKSADGAVLTLDDQDARALGVASRTVRDFKELETALGLGGKPLRQAKRTWVDSLVDTLNEPWVRGLLLFVGFFMLVLELKLPGIGLPAITATLAFLLYFWSSYLGGTADGLEIILFFVGLVCLGLELFVFPGLGIFGMSGVGLILVSIVMASHTFIVPTQDYEYRALAKTLLQVLGIIAATIAGGVVLGRYFPSLPIVNRLILRPEPLAPGALDPADKPFLDPDGPRTYLLGQTGRTSTVLRPTGRAWFGEELVDVIADGTFIEKDEPIEVVEVRGTRVVVKRA